MYRPITVLAALLTAASFAGCATTNNETPAKTAASSPTPKTAAVPAPAPAPLPSSSMAQYRMKSTGAAEPGARSIYYAYDQAELKSEDQRAIEAHARYLREHPDAKIRIEGNADERGSSEYNLALGQRRAESVARALRAGGVTEDRMEAVSFGREKPKALGHDEKSWAENRRSDMLYR
jgi:peptidoglycan-associated lipoprotein